MSFQLIPFEAVKNLPAKAGGLGNLAHALVHASSSYPVLSLKGKKFTRVSSGDKQVIMNPKDPDSAATSLGVVILDVSKVKPRVFYAKSYNPDEAEGRKPDCMSSDGIKPDANAENPQCKTCGACPNNVWGTKKRQDGSFGKGKACDETIRLAVAAPDRLTDPMLLRVPPSSLKAIPELAKFLRDRGFRNTYDVLVKISFDPEADAQKLVFTPVGALPPEMVAAAAEAAAMEVTQKIVQGDGAEYEGEAVAALPAEVTHEEAAAPAVAPKKAPAKKVADAVIAKAAATAAAAPSKEVTVDEVESVISATAAKPKAAAKPESDLSVDDLEIDGLDGIAFDDPMDD